MIASLRMRLTLFSELFGRPLPGLGSPFVNFPLVRSRMVLRHTMHGFEPSGFSRLTAHSVGQPAFRRQSVPHCPARLIETTLPSSTPWIGIALREFSAGALAHDASPYDARLRAQRIFKVNGAFSRPASIPSPERAALPCPPDRNYPAQ